MAAVTCRSRRQWLLAAGAAAIGAAQAGHRKVRLARPHFRLEPNGWYPYLLMQAALKASGTGWEPVIADRMTDARALIEMESPTATVDVVVGMPTKARAARLKLVPVPLYLGLFGWRVLVAPAAQAARWSGLRTLGDLKGLRLMHGAGWPDTDLLRANGLNIVPGTYVPEMYDRLMAGEADAFPRGITEAWDEVSTMGKGCEVVPQLCLHYRADLSFFVRRDDSALAETLTRGLQALMRTQQLHKLLMDTHGEAVRRAGLAGRHAIELVNPDLPAEMARLPAAWWTPPKAS